LWDTGELHRQQLNSTDGAMALAARPIASAQELPKASAAKKPQLNLLDDFVGAAEQRDRHRKAERLGYVSLDEGVQLVRGAHQEASQVTQILYLL
jgi:hypothetical protein